MADIVTFDYDGYGENARQGHSDTAYSSMQKTPGTLTSLRMCSGIGVGVRKFVALSCCGVHTRLRLAGHPSWKHDSGFRKLHCHAHVH